MYIRHLSRFAILAFASLFLNSAAHGGPSRQIREWNAYCTDTLSCAFSSYKENDAFHGLEFKRGNGASAPVTIALTAAREVAEGAGLTLSVPGQLEPLTIPAQFAKTEEGYLVFDDPRIETLLLPAMQAGEKLIISLETVEPTSPVELSLSGLTAVMLYLDEAQDRLDKTDALVRKGSKPATGIISRAVELKSSADLPEPVAAIWRSLPDECGTGFEDQDLIGDFGGIELALDNETTVKHYIIPCGGPGAYNLVYAAYMFDASTGAVRKMTFPTMGPKGPTVQQLIVNMSWDEQTSQVSAYSKGRGLGDCGTSSIWEWDGNGMYGNFVLVEERTKEDCDGNYDDWPLVWPVQ